MSSDDPVFSRPLKVAVASGKGGTGKTLVATGLAALASLAGHSVALIDCDVEAPNDHLFVPLDSPVVVQVNSPVAVPDPDLCNGCGICRKECAYGAPRIMGRTAMVFEELCHGCGLCTRACPEGAIHLEPRRVGQLEVGRAEGNELLALFSGRLDVGQVKAPPVVRAARERGESTGANLVILDAPPGVACTAVASTRAADVLILVTEPTPFGIHDLQLAQQLGVSLGIPMGIVINRDTGLVTDIEQLSEAWSVPILARIPFQREVAEVYAHGGNAALEIDSVGVALRSVLAALPELAGDGEDDDAEVWA